MLLFRSGEDWERCRAVHEKVLAMDPSQMDVRRRLEEVKAALAKKAAHRMEAQDVAPIVHAGVFQLSGLVHSGQSSHFS
jgi:hypothetical protein